MWYINTKPSYYAYRWFIPPFSPIYFWYRMLLLFTQSFLLLVRWSPQQTLVPSFFYLLLLLSISPKFRPWVGICGMCEAVCGCLQCVQVCVGVSRCVPLCAAVSFSFFSLFCVLPIYMFILGLFICDFQWFIKLRAWVSMCWACPGVHRCGINFQNFFWRLGS